jgi:anti-anti-sigma factor
MEFDTKDLTTDSIEIIPRTNIVSQDAGLFQKTCRQLVDDGKITLQINLAQVAYMDTAALGVLIGLRSLCKARHGALSVTNIKPSIKKILRTMRLDIVLGLELD